VKKICLFVFAGFRSKEDKNSESYFANTLQLRGFLPQKKFRRNEKSKRQHCSKDDLGTSWPVQKKQLQPRSSRINLKDNLNKV